MGHGFFYIFLYPSCFDQPRYRIYQLSRILGKILQMDDSYFLSLPHNGRSEPIDKILYSHYLYSILPFRIYYCLLYTSDAADEEDSVDLGGRRIIKKKKKKKKYK